MSEEITDIDPKEVAELQDARLNKLREATPEQARAQIEAITRALETSLLTYAARPGSDPDVLKLFRGLTGNLDNALGEGDSFGPLPADKLQDVKAGLAGAARIIDPAGGRYAPEGTTKDVGLAHRFLELAQKNVGKIDPQTGQSEIRQRMTPQQRGDVVRYAPPPANTPSQAR